MQSEINNSVLALMFPLFLFLPFPYFARRVKWKENIYIFHSELGRNFSSLFGCSQQHTVKSKVLNADLVFCALNNQVLLMEMYRRTRERKWNLHASLYSLPKVKSGKTSDYSVALGECSQPNLQHVLPLIFLLFNVKFR